MLVAFIFRHLRVLQVNGHRDKIFRPSSSHDCDAYIAYLFTLSEVYGVNVIINGFTDSILVFQSEM